METSRITKKGQITIPSRYRKMLNLIPGESVIFTLIDGNLVIKKATEDPIRQILGCGKEILEQNTILQNKLREEWN